MSKDPKKAPKTKKRAAKVSTAPKRISPRGLAAKKSAAYSNADIALQAYFIHEDRVRKGLPGDSGDDWLEAERQLSAKQAPKRAPRQRNTTDG